MRPTAQAITGPGAVEIDLNGLGGPERVLSSQDPARTTVVEQVGAHTHANWVFTAPGTYVVTMVAEATGLLVLGAVLALLVTPAATARLVTDRLGVMMTLAPVIGGLSALVGLDGNA